ncbi:intracellular sulfur oxidation DsrE/DsrF family protein [Kushneria sinocarnis]|uniref:Intracellular sulfur oxidation DsrE/DsrF family protein n=1 Tax=Kushneria sinocarnis TaxID=595502 RepID=A0A420WTX1_9GAMM|nr:DsrE family protein [Kushneria sinocarnis]RKQ96347.1 intracellular sulfur oxidation DsrE/DsrF family protein [Kushneria sinocarnis]
MGIRHQCAVAGVLATALTMLPLGAASARQNDSQGNSDRAVHPVIQEYGGVIPRSDDNTNQPDPDKTYHVIFDVFHGGDDPAKLNPQLDRLARAVNVFAAHGVDPDHLDFVAILHGDSTRSVMTEQAYQKRFGVANPDSDVIAALEQAGVQMEVCGQALSRRDISEEMVNSQVDVTPSSLVTLAMYGQKGYAYERF